MPSSSNLGHMRQRKRIYHPFKHLPPGCFVRLPDLKSASPRNQRIPNAEQLQGLRVDIFRGAVASSHERDGGTRREV